MALFKHTAQKWADLYQAVADGRTVQYLDDNGDWHDLPDPCLDDWRVDSYRVKPSERKPDKQ